MAWSKEEVESAVNKVGARAATDMAFRSLCVSNIHEAIKQETGLEIPSSFKIGVLDRSAYALSILLPKVQLAENELSEGELERVAGGSKDGANDFLDGMASGFNTVMGADDHNTPKNANGSAGNIMGQVIGSPILLVK